MIVLYCVGWLFIGLVTGFRLANNKKPKPIGNLVIMKDSAEDENYFALEIHKTALQSLSDGQTVTFDVKDFRQ